MVALIDKGQTEQHQKCVAVQKSIKGPLITTWPCVTEAMYFLGELRGWEGQRALWRLVENRAILIHSPHDDEWKRISELMEQYKDTPMDLADGSLVALAEAKGLRRIITLDSDFRIYRINGKDAFEIIPA
jgi:predicted nucleic acid-binding protein